jgi:hypothetical protein
MRSVQIEASAHRQSGGRASVSCVVPCGHSRDGFLLHSRPRASTFLPPFPRGGFASRPSAAGGGIGTMRALTPAALTQTDRSLRLPRLAFPTFRPQPPDLPAGRFVSRLSARGCFQASPRVSKLATASRRIRFVLLRTAGSPPVALHPASRRRSYLRLRSCDRLRHGLPPCQQGVLADALTPAQPAPGMEQGAGAHMWTAPCLQEAAQNLGRIACSHMSGLLSAAAGDRWPRWFPRRELRTSQRYWNTVGHHGLSRVWDRSTAPSAPSRASSGLSGM